MGTEHIRAGVSREAGVAAFSGILLAIAIGAAFDMFSRSMAGVGDLSALQRYVFSDLNSHLLKLMQLLVFLATTVRFYWGAYRYQEETRESMSYGLQFFFGMAGAILVFAGFYVTAIFITNVEVFYVGFAIFHICDLAWFVLVLKNLPSNMTAIGRFWITLDLVTLAILLIGIFLLYRNYDTAYVVQYAMLAVIVLVGALDLFVLRAFYRGDRSWHDSTFQWNLK